MLSLIFSTLIILILPSFQNTINCHILPHLQNLLLRRKRAFLRINLFCFIPPGTFIMLTGVARAWTIMFPILDALIKWLLYGFVDLAIPESHLIDFLLKMAIRFDDIGQLYSKILNFFMDCKTLVMALHLFLELQAKILYLLLEL